MKLSQNLEHQIWQKLKDHHLEHASSYLLAVSGGLDSIVLLEVMAKVRPQALLRVAHYHHGTDDGSGVQNFYRDEALAFVKEKTFSLKNTELIFEKSSVCLQTEDEMRTARWEFLRRNKGVGEAILTAHHQDDWIETVTLKLLRGVSEKGLLSFQVWNNEIFRPFLELSKQDLVQYAGARKIDWLIDPSNQATEFQRNWLREVWFKDLENKFPGAYHNLSKSLQYLIAELSHNSAMKLQFYLENEDNGLDRNWYLGLSERDQLKALALFVKSTGHFDITRGQLEEIQKRINTNQKNISFEIIRKWVINATQIMLA